MRYLCAVLMVVAGYGAPPPARNPVVRVVTVSQEDLDRGAGLLDDTMERLERAAAFRPDIACLPEVFVDTEPEALPGPVTKRLAEWAKRHSSYLIFGLYTRVDGKVYNSAVLLDREGRVAGRYDKIHPTERGLKKTHPGQPDPPVFHTDFGIVGVQICFDVNWWDKWRRLKEKGAKIVFFPAAYPAARQLSAIALENEYYIVSSSQSRISRIYDITGRTLAASGRFQYWAGAALPLGKRLFEIDFQTPQAREIQRKYGDRVELTWYHEDDWFTVASLDPQVTLEDLIAEYKLVPLQDYRRRALKAVEDARR